MDSIICLPLGELADMKMFHWTSLMHTVFALDECQTSRVASIALN